LEKGLEIQGAVTLFALYWLCRYSETLSEDYTCLLMIIVIHE